MGRRLRSGAGGLGGQQHDPPDLGELRDAEDVARVEMSPCASHEEEQCAGTRKCRLEARRYGEIRVQVLDALG
jgi:hypothetical protein